MSQPEFWQINPVQVGDLASGVTRRRTSDLWKKFLWAALLTAFFVGVVVIYLFNWGFYRVVESSSRRYSATAYFYSPVEFNMDIGLCVYDGSAPIDKVVSVGVVQKEGENGMALDSAYWSQDESSIVVYLWPGAKNPFIGYDFDQHQILNSKAIIKVLAQQGGKGREIIGKDNPFEKSSRARRLFETFPTDISQGW